MIIIHTQYRENYGSHDWDGTGECPQYWKNKGGETYVLDSSVNEFDFISALQYSTDYSEEFVIETYESDDLPEHDEWESLIFVTSARDGLFLCSRTTHNVDGMLYRSEIESKYSSWILGPGHKIDDHVVVYTMMNGDHINSKNLNDWFDLQDRINQVAKV